ncbi:MAG: antibiotic biosynthesis monooxygenase [Yoonia sp.]|nr:antibiotic biosynthesis monooxygenase [Yoonia sp.]
MSELTIVAAITVDPAKIPLLRPLFDALIVATRAEAGCIRYDLHHDNQDPSQFLFYETWESRDLWQDHMEVTHVKTFQKAAADLIVSVTLSEMTRI